MDGIPALHLCDLVIKYFIPHQIKSTKTKINRRRETCRKTPNTNMKNPNPTKHVNLDLNNVDHVSSNVRSSRFGAVLCVLEDNEAVIKMIVKGRSPTMRHVSRTHRVALDRLFERIILDPKIQIRYIDTRHFDQRAIPYVTNGKVFFICSTSAIIALSAVLIISALLAASQRWRKGSARRRRRRQGCGKIKPDDHEPDFNCLDKFLIRKPSDCVEKPGDTQSIHRET